MARIVKVTPAQVNAAKLKVKRSAATGRPVTANVAQIANAKRGTSVHRPGSVPTQRQAGDLTTDPQHTS
jgi:hypothetical protein